jgi:hypothetical protein
MNNDRVKEEEGAPTGFRINSLLVHAGRSWEGSGTMQRRWRLVMAGGSERKTAGKRVYLDKRNKTKNKTKKKNEKKNPENP